MIDLSKVRNYYIACGYTDLRYGIDGLAAADKKITYTAAEVADLIRPLSQSAEAL